MKENKKAQALSLAGMPLIIITLILAAFILVLGLQIQNGLSASVDNLIGTVVNESSSLTNTPNALDESLTAPGFNNPSITIIYNGTNGAIVIPAANYTLTGNSLTNATATSYSSVLVSYTYNYGGESFIASNQSMFSIASFADYWSMIVLAIVIALVIGLLLVIFNTRRTK